MDDLEAQRRAPFGDNPTVGGRGRATQRAILAAAIDAFDDVGFHHASVESITERVGCSRATFYQYFGGKEDLLLRLAGRFGEELGRLIDDLADIDATRAGRHLIRGWLIDLDSVYSRFRPVADTHLVMVRTDERLLSGSARLTRRYRDALARAIVDPADAPASAATLAATAANLAYAACHHRVRTRTVPQDRFVDALADVIHRALFGPIDGVNLSELRPRTVPEPGELTVVTADTSMLRPKGLRTRLRLLEAASVVFVRLGYDGTRVNDIADEADLSHGAFYRYFDDKAAIFRELAQAAAFDLVLHLRQLPDPPGGIPVWAGEHVRAYEQHQRLFSVWPEALAAGVGESSELVADVVAVLADALDDRPFGDVDADALICLALLDRVPSATFTTGSFTMEEASVGLATFVERGLLGRRL